MLVLVLLTVLLLPPSAVSSTFKKLEEKLRNVRSVKVLFIQKTRYSWYPKPELSKGVFYAARDGRFRIEYTYPDRIIITSDGKEIIVYNEEDREAIIDSRKNNTSPVIESLLFFSKPLSEVFEPVGEMSRDNVKVVILRPKRRDENIRGVYVEVDEDLKVRRIRVIDSEETETTIEFVDVRENFSPSPNLFSIELPPDVKVRRAESLR